MDERSADISVEETACARDEALELPELVERIIFHLPARDILTNASSVSRTWASFAKSSASIRRKLFLPTLKSTPVFPSHIFNLGDKDSIARIHDLLYDQHVMLNSLLSSSLVLGDQNLKVWALFIPFPSLPGKLAANMEFSIAPFNGELLGTEHGDNGSWRDMFLTDPPITMLLVVGNIERVDSESSTSDGESGEECYLSEYLSDGEFIVRDQGGITWGSLIDLACDFARLHDLEVNARADFFAQILDFTRSTMSVRMEDPQRESWRLNWESRARRNARRARYGFAEPFADRDSNLQI